MSSSRRHLLGTRTVFCEASRIIPASPARGVRRPQDPEHLTHSPCPDHKLGIWYQRTFAGNWSLEWLVLQHRPHCVPTSRLLAVSMLPTVQLEGAKHRAEARKRSIPRLWLLSYVFLFIHDEAGILGSFNL